MLGQFIVLVWLLALVTATDEPEEGCVNHPPSACPEVDLSNDKVCHCVRIEADTTVICCNIHSEIVLKEGLSCAVNKKESSLSGQQNKLLSPPVTALHILNTTLEKLDVGLFSKDLIGLSVTQSHISRIIGKFPSSMTCLNLSSNHLDEIDPQAFSMVPQLGYLDLSNNNLTHPPKLEFRNPKAHFFINLSGNSNLICKHLHELKMQKNSSTKVNFVNENETFCSTSAKYNWFNTIDVIPFHQLDTIDEIDKNCPRGSGSGAYECRCSMSRNVQLIDQQSTHYFVTVDCSGQGLTALPEELPPNTISLNVSNNNITHLDYLATHPSYRSIDSIYADNNRIESITVLEGSVFIYKFVRMSLRNNNIRTIPKYLLANAFDRNSFNKFVMLGNNKLICDCSTAQILKVWLLANKQRITDYAELLCENNMRVVDLDQAKVCVYPRGWTAYIYYIIALEILLFVLLVTKVSYDYWVFKTKGYLPWPASKMPRLPCDWVFEL